MTALFILLLTVGAPASDDALTNRCMSVQPICMPGTHAICVCDSDVSMHCYWECVGR